MPETFIKPKLKEETGSLLTTVNTYAPIASFSIRGYKSKTIVLEAETNDLEFRIEYSLDNSNWYVRLTDIDVSAGAFVVRDDDTNSELRGAWGYCRIQVRPNVADTHGTGTFTFEGSSL